MRFGIVKGNVVSTIKHEKLYGIKLAIVQPLDPDGNASGKEEIVADYLNADIGTLVFWTADGQAISDIMGLVDVPLRGSIIGIIDKIDMEHEKKVINGYSYKSALLEDKSL